MTLKDISHGPDWIIWIVGILFAVISIILISGHGANLIAGYNTARIFYVYTYFAFSYKSEDKEWAFWLKRQLQSYRLPAKTHRNRRDLPKRCSPIFLDRTNLTPGLLDESLRSEVQSSKYLIIICSRNASKCQGGIVCAVNIPFHNFINHKEPFSLFMGILLFKIVERVKEIIQSSVFADVSRHLDKLLFNRIQSRHDKNFL